jgi:hypothetical protein
VWLARRTSSACTRRPRRRFGERVRGFGFGPTGRTRCDRASRARNSLAYTARTRLRAFGRAARATTGTSSFLSPSHVRHGRARRVRGRCCSRFRTVLRGPFVMCRGDGLRWSGDGLRVRSSPRHARRPYSIGRRTPQKVVVLLTGASPAQLRLQFWKGGRWQLARLCLPNGGAGRRRHGVQEPQCVLVPLLLCLSRPRVRPLHP